MRKSRRRRKFIHKGRKLEKNTKKSAPASSESETDVGKVVDLNFFFSRKKHTKIVYFRKKFQSKNNNNKKLFFANLRHLLYKLSLSLLVHL